MYHRKNSAVDGALTSILLLAPAGSQMVIVL
jgi:hypothetical protein